MEKERRSADGRLKVALELPSLTEERLHVIVVNTLTNTTGFPGTVQCLIGIAQKNVRRCPV